jgi:hypothetical protein
MMVGIRFRHDGAPDSSTVAGEAAVFDNGYIRIQSQDSEAKVSEFATNDAGNLNSAI